MVCHHDLMQENATARRPRAQIEENRHPTQAAAQDHRPDTRVSGARTVQLRFERPADLKAGPYT